MKLDKRAAERLEAMTNKAGQLMATYTRAPSNFIGHEGWVDTDVFAEWRTQSLNLLRQLLGSDHTYSQAFEEATTKPGAPSSVKKGLGVLRAVAEDLANDHLFDARALMAAEVFADFLEMASHLVEQGYSPPAASLAGAVLEDGLRRVADASAVVHSKRDGLFDLNEKLLKAGVYNKITSSKVDTWRNIRNEADHGHFTSVNTSDVKAMIEGTTDLLDRLLK